MGRLGSFEVPQLTLTDAVEVARRASRTFGPAFSRGGLARLLGLDPRGGWFAAVVASLRIWGLVDGRGTLRLTSSGARVLDTSSAGSSADARRQAVLGVPLLRELGARSPGGVDAGRAELALAVEEITGAPGVRVRASLAHLQRVIADALPADGRATVSQPDREKRAPDPAEAEANPGEPGRVEVVFSGGKISLPETAANLELVIQLLQGRAQELRAARGI